MRTNNGKTLFLLILIAIFAILITGCKDKSKEYVNAGLNKSFVGNHKLAIEDYNKAIDSNPKNYTAYYWRGYSYYVLEDNEAAISDFNKAIELKPFYSAYLSRGDALSSLGKYKSAFKDYAKALELIPVYEDKNIFTNRAKELSEKDDIRGAILFYNKAIELDSLNPIKYSDRGNFKAKQKDFMGAKLDYNKEIEINPESSGGYYSRSIAEINLGEYKAAINDMNKAIELTPFFLYYNQRGRYKYEYKDLIEAIEDFSNCINVAPKAVICYVNRGYAKYSLGDINGACLDWSKAGELGSAEAYEIINENCN